MVSHLKQRHGFTEHKVSHVELRLNSHRRPGLTEGRASQKAGPYRMQGLTESKVSEKEGSHRRQGFTEDRVSPIKQRQGPTEGRSLVWLQACVSHMTQCRVSHNRQGNRGFRTWRCFHPWNHTLPNCCSPLLLPHANCSCSLSGWRQNDRTGPGHSSITEA